MEDHFNWSWVEAQTAASAVAWKSCARSLLPAMPRHSLQDQRTHERAYDRGLKEAERAARSAQRGSAGRREAQQKITALFPVFASSALGLDAASIELLSKRFLPIGAEFARWTRAYDPALSTEDTIQACRNAWIACGMQALTGQPMELTPSIVAYSLLYPYSDNYLDDPLISEAEKCGFNERFRRRLSGDQAPATSAREASVWAMVRMIEEQYPRPRFPQVFASLLAIHRAQGESLRQLGADLSGEELLLVSCAKGGSSVVADACLVEPKLSADEVHFAFAWGVLLQLGDDLQDVRSDLARGSQTLFTRAARRGMPLDAEVAQLLCFSRMVSARMEQLANGSATLKELLRFSWRSLILMAVADTQEFFSPAFLSSLEPHSSLRFGFMRERQLKLAGRQALFAKLCDAFVEDEKATLSPAITGMALRAAPASYYQPAAF
jgi:hypothetical protein